MLLVSGCLGTRAYFLSRAPVYTSGLGYSAGMLKLYVPQSLSLASAPSVSEGFTVGESKLVSKEDQEAGSLTFKILITVIKGRPGQVVKSCLHLRAVVIAFSPGTVLLVTSLALLPFLPWHIVSKLRALSSIWASGHSTVPQPSGALSGFYFSPSF